MKGGTRFCKKTAEDFIPEMFTVLSNLPTVQGKGKEWKGEGYSESGFSPTIMKTATKPGSLKTFPSMAHMLPHLVMLTQLV